MNETQLQQEMQAAMRAREMQRVYVLRGVIAAIKNLKVEKQVKILPEGDVVGLVRKEISKRVEAIGFAEKAGRADLVEQNQQEKKILEAYVPKQLDEAALESAIRAISAALGTTQIGPVMAELRSRHAGEYDGKMASELVKKLATG